MPNPMTDFHASCQPPIVTSHFVALSRPVSAQEAHRLLCSLPASHSHLTFCRSFQAHFSPGGAALGAPLQSSLQTVDPQIAAAAAAAAARYNPQVQQACSGITCIRVTARYVAVLSESFFCHAAASFHIVRGTSRVLAGCITTIWVVLMFLQDSHSKFEFIFQVAFSQVYPHNGALPCGCEPCFMRLAERRLPPAEHAAAAARRR